MPAYIAVYISSRGNLYRKEVSRELRETRLVPTTWAEERRRSEKAKEVNK
jgi:hypothetical protein